MCRAPGQLRTSIWHAPAGTLEAAEAELRRRVERHLGDYLTFELTSSRATGRGDNQPGVDTRRLVFTCRDTDTGRTVGDVPVNLVVGHRPVGEVETVEPVNRMLLHRHLPSAPYRLYPLVDHVADKVCATMSTYTGRSSSRVKDLVDLAVIARTQRLDMNQLRSAITAKRDLAGLDPFEEFTIPDTWAKTYRQLASSTPAAGELVDVAETSTVVSSMINPTLARSPATPAVWVPERGWLDPAEAAAIATTIEEEAGGTVHVRSHIRAGWPVVEHWRNPRDSG